MTVSTVNVTRVTPAGPTEWDQQFEGISDAGICQSRFYARVIERVHGAEPLYLRVTDGQRNAALCLMLRRPRPGVLGMLPVATLDCIDGPVFLDRNEHTAAEAIRELLTWVEGYAKKSRIGEIRWTEPAGGASESDALHMSAVFTSMGYTPTLWSTFLVDLTQSEDFLWGNLNRAARKGINKCTRQGVEVRQIRDYKDFQDAFFRPYRAAQVGSNQSPSIFEAMFEEDVDQRYAYFVAEDAYGETLATLGVHGFGGVSKEIASSLAPRAREESIPAQDVLHWQVLKWAKEHGSNTFDLAGVAPDPSDPKEEGIRHFKEKWGGRYVEFHRFEKALAPARFLRSTRKALAGLGGRRFLGKAVR